MDEFMQMHPFSWGFHYADKYISTAEQRNAEWTDALEGEFKGNGQWAYFSSEMPPTTQVRNVCGIECPECEGSSGEGGDGGNEGGGDDSGNTGEGGNEGGNTGDGGNGDGNGDNGNGDDGNGNTPEPEPEPTPDEP